MASFLCRSGAAKQAAASAMSACGLYTAQASRSTVAAAARKLPVAASQRSWSSSCSRGLPAGHAAVFGNARRCVPPSVSWSATLFVGADNAAGAGPREYCLGVELSPNQSPQAPEFIY